MLARTRDLKMARSVHAYVRGNTAQLYEWLEASPVAASIPEGPAVWICGDCHLGNLGPVADADRHVDIQIRDLDQTVIANPAYDLTARDGKLDAASWLWQFIVAMAGAHDVGYLEHCRRFILNK